MLADYEQKLIDIRAMLGLSHLDDRVVCRASGSTNPRVIVDCHNHKWDITYGVGWVAITVRLFPPKFESPSRVGSHLSDLVVFYRESELALWRKGQINAQNRT